MSTVANNILLVTSHSCTIRWSCFLFPIHTVIFSSLANERINRKYSHLSYILRNISFSMLSLFRWTHVDSLLLLFHLPINFFFYKFVDIVWACVRRTHLKIKRNYIRCPKYHHIAQINRNKKERFPVTKWIDLE
jgi:hypothetical protein